MALPRHARLASWWIEGLRFLSAYVVLGDAMADTNNVQKCTCNDSGLIRYFANKWHNLCAKITVDLTRKYARLPNCYSNRSNKPHRSRRKQFAWSDRDYELVTSSIRSFTNCAITTSLYCSIKVLIAEVAYTVRVHADRGVVTASTSWASLAARAKAELDCATLWVCFAYMPKP